MYLTVKDLTIYYEKYGNGKNIILILPGWGNTRETFRYIIDYFKDKYTIYIIDYPGLGKSPIPTKTLNIYNYKIDKLILIDVAGIKPKKTIKKYLKEKIYKLKKKLIKLLPKQKQSIYKQKLFRKYASSDYLLLPPTMRETFKNIINEDLTKHFKEIKTETLLIWGENDQDTPLKDGIKINKLIKDSALITLKKASHYCYLQYPILVNKIIYEFIKKDQ